MYIGVDISKLDSAGEKKKATQTEIEMNHEKEMIKEKNRNSEGWP